MSQKMADPSRSNLNNQRLIAAEMPIELVPEDRSEIIIDAGSSIALEWPTNCRPVLDSKQRNDDLLQRIRRELACQFSRLIEMQAQRKSENGTRPLAFDSPIHREPCNPQ